MAVETLKAKKQRIKDELKAAGAGAIGLHTPEGSGLIRMLHGHEHIKAVVYGRTITGLSWLVATNEKVFYLDRKPFFTTSDELSYDVVSGVQKNKAGPFYNIVLHTRLGDYSVRFVTKKCADIFVKYIEERRLESEQQQTLDTIQTAPEVSDKADEDSTLPVLHSTQITPEALDFISSHDECVLSTIDRTGNVHGSVMYYHIGPDGFIYMLTKSTTEQGRNIILHPQVALNVYESGTTTTAEIHGFAEVETDQYVKDQVFSKMIKPRQYKSGPEMPPVTKMPEGNYIIVKIKPSTMNFHNYSKSE